MTEEEIALIVGLSIILLAYIVLIILKIYVYKKTCQEKK